VLTGAVTASAASARPAKALEVITNRPASTAAIAHAAQGCTNYNIPKDSKPGYAIVGEINNAYRDTKATFGYGNQADSEISVGMLEDGKWNVTGHGSVTVSNSRSASSTRTRKGPYARRISSQFQYQLSDTIVCAPYGPKYPTVKAQRWNGGFNDRKQTGTLFVCRGGINYRGGDTFNRTDSSATIWKAGGGAFGASLDVQSGFSKFVRISYKFGGSNARVHRLCGSGGRAPTDAPRIFSGKAR
jgi:hypothetical protein